MAEQWRGFKTDSNPPESFTLSQLTFLVAELQELLAEVLEPTAHPWAEPGTVTTPDRPPPAVQPVLGFAP